MRTLALSLVSALAMQPAASHAADTARFYGHWCLDSIAGYADISEGDTEARKLLGKPMQISPNAFTIAGDACNNPSATTVIDVDSFLANDWKTTRRDLALGRFTLGHRAPHLDAGCADALVLAANELLVDNGGAFFLASRQP